ncbi:MAG TPA: hypothetical protein VLA72_19155 [Anaerolineales bacterium]|nr:hypothetical protein [Anaerolineales bacterium]
MRASVCGTKFADVVEDSFAEVGFYSYGNGVCTDFIDSRQQGAPRNDEQNKLQPMVNLRKSLSLNKDSIDGAADEVSLADRQQTG